MVFCEECGREIEDWTPEAEIEWCKECQDEYEQEKLNKDGRNTNK